jgi:hypothetical protein
MVFTPPVASEGASSDEPAPVNRRTDRVACMGEEFASDFEKGPTRLRCPRNFARATRILLVSECADLGLLRPVAVE